MSLNFILQPFNPCVSAYGCSYFHFKCPSEHLSGTSLSLSCIKSSINRMRAARLANIAKALFRSDINLYSWYSIAKACQETIKRSCVVIPVPGLAVAQQVPAPRRLFLPHSRHLGRSVPLQRPHGRPLLRQFVPLPKQQRLQQRHRRHLRWGRQSLRTGRVRCGGLLYRGWRLPGSTVVTWYVSHNSGLWNSLEWSSSQGDVSGELPGTASTAPLYTEKEERTCFLC